MVATEKRYQVFVSSTYLDLKDERRAVIEALLTLDAIPAGMELFPASNATAWNLIKQVIDDCDYYLVVLGGKYGSIDPDCDLSYTEKEYDYAISTGKPVMAFLHGDTGAIPGNKLDLNEMAAEKLKLFRKKVENGSHVKYWNSPDQLAGQVALSLPTQIKLFPATGWIRADRVTTAESLQVIETLRKRVSELEAQVEVAAHTPPPGASQLESGSDSTTLAIDASFRYTFEKGSKPSRSSLAIEREFTWNEIFSMASPHLLGECEQDQLREAIDEWITDHLWSDDVLPTEVAHAFSEAELDLKDVTFFDFSLGISVEDFHGILIQFVALGLVEKGTRKRPVADYGTYWTLTPYGKTMAVQIMAKKKST